MPRIDGRKMGEKADFPRPARCRANHSGRLQRFFLPERAKPFRVPNGSPFCGKSYCVAFEAGNLTRQIAQFIIGVGRPNCLSFSSQTSHGT
jgi:hypothetical protein